jgi:hypothetical protein
VSGKEQIAALKGSNTMLEAFGGSKWPQGCATGGNDADDDPYYYLDLDAARQPSSLAA